MQLQYVESDDRKRAASESVLVIGHVERNPSTEVAEGGASGDGTVVLALNGDALVGGIADLRWRLDTVLRSGTSTLVIDVSDIPRLSSATVAMLLWVARRCQARRVRLLVRNPSRASQELLRRTGLLDVLEIAGAPQDEVQAPVGPPTTQHRPTRVKLWGGESAPATARRIARQWCRERVLPDAAEERLTYLLSEFVSYALTFEPRSVSVALGWRDADHMSCELRWRGRSFASASGSYGPPYSASTVAAEWTEEWGYDVRNAVRSAWFVVDARDETA